MRDDILLDGGGDLKVNDFGDITLTDSIRQAVQIRLRWFLEEWRFAPDFGVPWFEEVLIKNPNDIRVKQIIREECMTVEGVTDARNITLTIDPVTRQAVIALAIVTGEESYREEVKIRI
jgi:hypothetical protein